MKPKIVKVKRKVKRKPLSKKQVRENRLRAEVPFCASPEDLPKEWGEIDSTGEGNPKDEPALDIQVDTGKPIEDFKIENCRTENYGTDNQPHETWELNDGTKIRWNPDADRYEEVEERNVWSNLIAAAAVLFVFAAGITLGHYANQPKIEYRDKYSHPIELNGIPDNPWGPKKIILLPEDIKILPGYDENGVKRA